MALFPRISRRYVFIATVSILAHALVLTLPRPSRPATEMATVSPAQTALYWSAITAPASPHKPQSHSKPASKPKTHTAHDSQSKAKKPSPTITNRPTSPHEIIDREETATPAAAVVTSDAGHDSHFQDSTAQRSLHNEPTLPEPPTLILDAVRRKFEQQKYYPALARRRGWEGDVLLNFRIENDGRIVSVRINRSSGHALLDASAAESLRNISMRDEVQALSMPISLELQIPITYRLVDAS